MSFFTRLSNGWELTKNSFKVLRENKELIIFPILSGVSLILITGSFIVAFMASVGWDVDSVGASEGDNGNMIAYTGITFLFYLVNYFVVIFFNMALIHCTRMYFHGEPVSIRKGLQFSVSRIGAILSWSLFAATVGTILRMLQENLGIIGKIITGLIGIVWSITTFFVVPIIAYENVGPIDAFKRSASLMRKQWGESLVANFSFALVQTIGILVVSVALFFLGSLIHPFLGIALAILGAFVVMAVISATQTIFISAVYHNINGDPVKNFNEGFANNLFNEKD
jgi:hypothetical protein